MSVDLADRKRKRVDTVTEKHVPFEFWVAASQSMTIVRKSSC